MEKKGQVWIETVVYTLIGLVIIGIVISIATPKIKQMTDRAVVEQTITALNELNSKVYVTQTAEGNSRELFFKIKKGKLVIDSAQNKIYYLLEETNLMYSQPGAEIRQGDIKILTEEKNKKYSIRLGLDYNLDITFGEKNENKVLSQAPTAYHLLITNEGGGILNINLI